MFPVGSSHKSEISYLSDPQAINHKLFEVAELISPLSND